MTDTISKVNLGWKLDNSYARLPKKFFAMQNPNPVSSPKLILLNGPVVETLGLRIAELQSREGEEVLGGNAIPEGSSPIAQAYAGHQFGHFTMLGDGRAVLLGEQITPKGERFDIQLKGSGRTPYSRGGDGRAALGPMLREYIISEAMHALGIPTTRSLAVVTTGEPVFRETKQPGAILTRVASSHIRVGTFEYAYNFGTLEELRALADYTLERHFPGYEAQENRYLYLLNEVIKGQAALIAQWMMVGFIHGVMNTDNMTLSGETIDYGPCAFMDTYDPATVFSSIDVHGRYSYGNQQRIAGWNLARFAETLLPLLHEDENKALELAQNSITEFSELYHKNWLSGMRAKLGLFNEEPEDEALIEDLLSMMKNQGADYTNTFKALTYNKTENLVMLGSSEFNKWHEQWKGRLTRQQRSREDCETLMKNSNPSVIPRNHRVEEALEAAVKNGDYSMMDRLVAILSCPYAYSEEQEEFSTLPGKSNKPYRTFCGT